MPARRWELERGVSPRQELPARIFIANYMPHIGRRAPLSSTGGFSDPADPR